jgi:hypothetical protein
MREVKRTASRCTFASPSQFPCRLRLDCGRGSLVEVVDGQVCKSKSSEPYSLSHLVSYGSQTLQPTQQSSVRTTIGMSVSNMSMETKRKAGVVPSLMACNNRAVVRGRGGVGVIRIILVFLLPWSSKCVWKKSRIECRPLLD